MRTILTMNDDVVTKLKAEIDEMEESLKNRTREKTFFKVITRDLGQLHSALSSDKIQQLLDLTEGPLSR